MHKTFSPTLVLLAMATGFALGAPPDDINKRGLHEYGPPIHISSSILSIQQDEGSLNEGADTTRLSHGEWGGIEFEGANHQSFDAGSSGYLKFVGVVGSGHVYVPDGSGDHFGKISDGILAASQW